MSMSTPVLKGRGMARDEQQLTETDKLLALKFPNVPKAWLRRLDERLGLLKRLNGGHADMRVRWSKGRADWTDWTDRDLTPRQID